MRAGLRFLIDGMRPDPIYFLRVIGLVNARILSIGIFLSLCFGQAPGCAGEAPAASPAAVRGFLNLENIDFRRSGAVILRGEWEFVSGRLLAPEDFAARRRSTDTGSRNFAAVPHEWLHARDAAQAPLPINDAATYRLLVRLPREPGPGTRFALRVPEQGTAHRIFVDGAFLASNGVVAADRDDHVPELRPLLAAFQPRSPEVEIVVQISNYTHRNGGLWLPLRFGPEDALREERRSERDSEIFLCGSLFILGVYHLTFFSLRRRDRAALHFGLFCLVVALRVLTTGDHYLVQLFPDWGYAVHHRLEYLSFYLALPTFALYVRSAFPGEAPRNPLLGMVALSLGFALLVLVTQPYVYSHSLPYFQMLTVVCGIFAAGVGVLGVLRDRAGAWLFLIGWLCFFAGILHDIAVANSLFYNVFLTPHAVLVFVFAQAAMLALRFAGAFRRSEELRSELSRAERRYRGIFEQAAEGVFLFEAGGRIVAVNRAFEDLLGFVRGEAPGNIFSLFADGESVAQFREALEAGELHDFECRLRGTREVEAAISARRLTAEESGEEPSAPRYQAMLQDISERRRAEELRIQRDSAEAANRSKSLFLANMSHEIRTPMNAILGMGDLLAENPPESRREKYLNILRGAGRTLLVLIDDILDIARIEAGRLELEEAPFDLVETVESTVEMLAVQAHGRGIELSHRIVGFGPGETPPRLRGDSTRLRQILVNLIGNALKFTPEGSVAVEIVGRPDGTGGCRIEATVRDTGIGIPADRLEAIFEAFSQADNSTTRRFGGSGLGLAISQRLVKLMGGEIQARSEEGRGSTFAFSARFAIAAEERQVGSGDEVDLAGVRILIVDDMEFNRLTFEEILAGRGAVCASVASGAEGMRVLREGIAAGRPFELALVDYHMPEMNGLELARSIRADADAMLRATPIIAATSDTLADTVDGFRKVGVRAHLFKPVRRSQLLEAVAAALDRAVPGGGASQAGAGVRSNSTATVKLGAPERGGRWRILMAEDNEDNQTLIRAYLRNLPVDLTIAPDGQAALEHFRSGSYDLVLMDMQMPGMDGYDATREIRSYEMSLMGSPEDSSERTPIVALTAHAMSDEVERILEIGCDAHLSKPVKKTSLVDAIVKYARSADS